MEKVVLLIWNPLLKLIQSHILFNEAVEMLRESSYYEFNGNRKMWEELGTTQESFCREQLIQAIKDKKLSLYGRKVFGTNKNLQKIDIEEYNQLGKENNLVSNLNEIIYRDLKIDKKALLSFIKTLKDLLN
jgi:arsenate reductase-like glutaredoxin family protein